MRLTIVHIFAISQITKSCPPMGGKLFVIILSYNVYILLYLSQLYLLFSTLDEVCEDLTKYCH